MKSPFIIACFAVAILPFAPKPAAAQSSTARVNITPMQNYGTLSHSNYLTYPGPNGTIYDVSASISANARLNQIASLSGATYSEVRNDTASAVTLTNNATFTFSASGEVVAVHGDASSSISFGLVTASGAATIVNTIYSDADNEKTQSFVVVNMAPGDNLIVRGSFGLDASASR